MNRQIIYAGAIPLDTDLLQIQKNIQTMFSALIQAAFGSMTQVDGFNITPTSPASMQVMISSGSIIDLTTADTTNFGSLPLDNTPTVKLGINLSPTTLTLTAPPVAGQSINYLVEAAYQQQDGTPVVLPFYNAANPVNVFSGPGNNGTASNTVRADTVNISIRAGSAAATGSQPTPTPNSGYTALGVVTVAYGQTTITSANITQYLTPYVGTKLGNLRTQLTGNLTLYVNSATGNANNSGLSMNDPIDTIQNAYALLVKSYDIQNNSVTISVAPGSGYSNTIIQGAITGFGANSNIIIQASGTVNLTSTGAFSCMGVYDGASVYVGGFTMSGQSGLTVFSNAYAVDNGNTYGTMSGSGGGGFSIYALGGQILLAGNSVVTGGGTAFYSAINGGRLTVYGSPTLTINNDPTFSLAFIDIKAGSLATMYGSGPLNITGSCVGQRYNAICGGAIDTNNSGPNYFPGTSAGTVNSGTTYSGFYY